MQPEGKGGLSLLCKVNYMQMAHPCHSGKAAQGAFLPLLVKDCSMSVCLLSTVHGNILHISLCNLKTLWQKYVHADKGSTSVSLKKENHV